MKTKVYLLAYNPTENKELREKAEAADIETLMEKYDSDEFEFTRIPTIGEYVALSTHDPRYFKVVLVVHTPFDNAQWDAEVYVIAEDFNEVIDASGYRTTYSE